MKFKLQEDLINTHAFMVSKRNEWFPTDPHVYGDVDDPDVTSYACEWMYDHIHNDKIKSLIFSFFKSWALQGEPECDEDYLINDLVDYVDDFIDCGVASSKFILKHAKEIENAEEKDLDELNSFMVQYLNNNFLRARYGGSFDTNLGSKEMVFRISSNGFNWFDIIWAFVYDHKNEINCVTIVRDKESTGEDWFYNHNGKIFNLMSVNEFIELSGNPIVEEMEDMKFTLLEAPQELNQNLSPIVYPEAKKKLITRKLLKDLINTLTINFYKDYVVEAILIICGYSGLQRKNGRISLEAEYNSELQNETHSVGYILKQIASALNTIIAPKNPDKNNPNEKNLYLKRALGLLNTLLRKLIEEDFKGIDIYSNTGEPEKVDTVVQPEKEVKDLDNSVISSETKEVSKTDSNKDFDSDSNKKLDPEPERNLNEYEQFLQKIVDEDRDTIIYILQQIYAGGRGK